MRKLSILAIALMLSGLLTTAALAGGQGNGNGNQSQTEEVGVITSYSIHYTKLYEALWVALNYLDGKA